MSKFSKRTKKGTTTTITNENTLRSSYEIYKQTYEKEAKKIAKYGIEPHETKFRNFNEYKINIKATINDIIDAGERVPSYSKLAKIEATNQVYEFSQRQGVAYQKALQSMGKKVTQAEARARGLTAAEFEEIKQTYKELTGKEDLSSYDAQLWIAQVFFGSK